MTQKIFTKESIKRRDLFEKLIQVMVNGGWQLLNADTSKKYIMFSEGTSGDKKMYLELLPYDGVIQSDRDMRNKRDQLIASNGLMRWGNAYNPVTDTMTYLNTSYIPLPFDNNRAWSNFKGVSRTNSDYDLDFYYYVDKDRVMYFLKHGGYTNYPNLFHMFGLPEESYIEEDYTGFPTNFISLGTGGMPSSQQCYIASRPLNFLPKGATRYEMNNYSTLPPMSPNADSEFPLSEILFGRSDEGLRFRVGGFYVVKPNSKYILDGDLIVATEKKADGTTEIQKYRFCDAPKGADGWTALPAEGIAIRVE